MSAIDASMEPMLDMFMFETTTLLEQLDGIILEAEKSKNFSEGHVAEIFRIMHTIKGSSSMMGLEAISHLAHSVEDMFFIIRDDNSKQQRSNRIFDLVLQCSDYFKNEVDSITGVGYEASDSEELNGELKKEIAVLKGEAPASGAAAPAAPKETATEPVAPTVVAAPTNEGGWVKVIFEDGCQMENIRAFMLINQIKECCEKIETVPSHPEANSASAEEIAKNGLLINFFPANIENEIDVILNTAMNISSYEFLKEAPAEEPVVVEEKAPEVKVEEPAKTAEVAPAQPAPAPTPAAPKAAPATAPKEPASGGGKQSLISVKQDKLDQLMDVVSELVISESMVASNPDLKGLQLDNFNKAMRELRKLTDELQDISMSMRMVTLQSLFQKMNRIIRDMSKKLGKQVELVTIGEDTEIDKTINDLIQDPVMQLTMQLKCLKNVLLRVKILLVRLL